MEQNYYLHMDELEDYSKEFQDAVIREFDRQYKDIHESKDWKEFFVGVHDDYECDITPSHNSDYVKICPYEETENGEALRCPIIFMQGWKKIKNI